MSGGMYFVQPDGDLTKMTEQLYETEEKLQELLARHPYLLGGDAGDQKPRKWLLVSREVQVTPGSVCLDHLFLDQEGIPTFVEVKRSTNPQIRREIVGQLLDYAGNAVASWSSDAIKGMFEARCGRDGANPEELLAEVLGEDDDPAEFWERVGTNLQAARIRMLFVADTIPPELQNIIEFLGRQLKTAEVYGVEVRQYVGEGVQTLAPRIVGQVHPEPSQRHWDEASFFDELAKKGDKRVVEAAKRILQWAQTKRAQVHWGKGLVQGSLVPGVMGGGFEYRLFTVWTTGHVEFGFSSYAAKPAFEDDSKRLALLHRLNGIEGVRLPDDAIGKWPKIPLSVLAAPQGIEKFLATFDWVVEEITAGEAK